MKLGVVFCIILLYSYTNGLKSVKFVFHFLRIIILIILKTIFNYFIPNYDVCSKRLLY